MASQKLENLLNLALDATASERENSLNLDIGYEPIDKEWTLIVQYTGSLAKVRELAGSVVELQNGYAIITIKESLIERLTQIIEVSYVEKPKRLFFQVANGRRVSCIQAVQSTRLSLYGQGVLIAVIDSGIDYANPDFQNADGTTRIRALWDQSLRPREGEAPPEGYAIGVEYTAEEINAALKQSTSVRRQEIVAMQDVSGHGTAVAGIVAGNGRQSGGVYAGIAPESELIVVKMGNTSEEGFPRTTELMQGVDYAVRKAIEYRMPVAINISFGNTYGSHEGTSLVERFLDEMSNVWKNVICVGAGNEGTTAGHTAGRMRENQEEEIQFGVQTRERSINIQIWKSYTDEIEISLINPSGVRVGPISSILGTQRFIVGNTEILLYYGEPNPYSVRQEIYLDFLPGQTYVDAGVWKIVLTPKRIVSGEYQMWLPSQSTLNIGTAFLFPNSSDTITIPSTAERVITVGAYDALTFTYADFSGRGALERREGTAAFKPDLVAPGVKVTTVRAGGGYEEVSGTSFATPFVTGSAALLMEWGIVKGNDPYLYGEKVKAYLRKGARELPGFREYPNNQAGYGEDVIIRLH